MHVHFADFQLENSSHACFHLTVRLVHAGNVMDLERKLEVDPVLVIPDDSLSLKEHAIAPWEPTSSQYYPELLKTVAKHYGITMTVPVSKLSEEQLDKIFKRVKR